MNTSVTSIPRRITRKYELDALPAGTTIATIATKNRPTTATADPKFQLFRKVGVPNSAPVSTYWQDASAESSYYNSSWLRWHALPAVVIYDPIGS